jgi:uncharacterized membrane-anchored protein
MEHSINVFESKTNPWYVVFSLILLVLDWIFAIFALNGLEQASDKFGFIPIILLAVVSYFFFFLGSKLIILPSDEELSDDTSALALFSACGRKSFRSLVSIGSSLLHTLIFTVYLISKDIERL